MATGNSASGPLWGVGGVRMATVAAGIRYRGRDDVVLIELAPGSRIAGVFTRNAFCAAPVLLAREHLQRSEGHARYLLINAGNANAGTGEAGLQDARESCAALARAAGVAVEQVLPFSTGVIGEKLPLQRLIDGATAALSQLAADNWDAAARGIMTTDTRPKAVSRQLSLSGTSVSITGICKGAGMIRPDMATMLAYVVTDAGVAQADLQQLLHDGVAQSFNRITVDGDTSTNDCCMLAATGASGLALQADDSEEWRTFAAAVQAVLRELAISVIRDAEGACKFVTVQVDGGRDVAECLQVAYTIAESPLVKTALTASDPNWGRILAAIGRAGVSALDVSKVSIHLGDVCIVEDGMVAGSYTEAAGQAVMQQEDILVRVDLRRGQVSETVWTSDLSEEYVRINASYRS